MSLTEKFIFLDLPLISGMYAPYMHQREYQGSIVLDAGTSINLDIN